MAAISQTPMTPPVTLLAKLRCQNVVTT